MSRLAECVSHIHAKLCSIRKASFSDSLIGNARELCDILTRLNLADDANLESLRRQTEMLAMTEPSTLRDNPDVRSCNGESGAIHP